jgi:hypothetical protein
MVRAQGLGGVHPVIMDVPVFTDAEGDRMAEAAMWQEFREVGLVDRRERLDADALDSLGALARPAVEYFAVFTERGAQHLVLVAALGNEAVVVVRAGDAVTLSSIANRALPETLVSYLPQVPPARVDAINIRLADLDAAGDDPHAILLEAQPGAARDAALARMLRNQPATGMGELYTAARDRWGNRALLTDPLLYRDSAVGRIFVRYAGDYLSIAPATPALLAQRLRDAHRALTT